MLYMWLYNLILLSNITAYVIIIHIIIVHIVFTLLMEAIHLSIHVDLLWVIHCKYYRYIASYPSLNMT